jgi:hypothetical protein
VFTNVYAIGEPGNWCLVDAGLYFSAARIRARPARGRYVRQPAVTDENGVVSVPPPDPAYIRTRALVIGAGIGAAAVWLVRARRAGEAGRHAGAG